MKERVETFNGKHSVIIVAPHGYDDKNTGIIADTAIDFGQFYGVINHGFRKSDFVDAENDLANCNRIDHLLEDVVQHEFLRPLEKRVKTIQRRKSLHFLSGNNAHPTSIMIFYIHGCSNNVSKKVNSNVHCVIGWGQGKNENHSNTCTKWRKDCFAEKLYDISRKTICEAGPGSDYAGRSLNNLNQYFKSHTRNGNIETMQLEYPYSERYTKAKAKSTGFMLSEAIHDLLVYKTFNPTMKLPII